MSTGRSFGRLPGDMPEMQSQGLKPGSPLSLGLLGSLSLKHTRKNGLILIFP